MVMVRHRGAALEVRSTVCDGVCEGRESGGGEGETVPGGTLLLSSLTTVVSSLQQVEGPTKAGGPPPTGTPFLPFN